jgi:hypothetical protein
LSSTENCVRAPAFADFSNAAAPISSWLPDHHRVEPFLERGDGRERQRPLRDIRVRSRAPLTR